MISTAIIVVLFPWQSAPDPCAQAEPQLKAAAHALAGHNLEQAGRILGPLEMPYMSCWKVGLALGRLQYELGDYRRANAFSEQALLAAPESPEALILRGQMLLMQDQKPRAQELLERACKLDPNNPEAHYQLGVLHDAGRRNPEAVAEFEKVVRLRPTDARAYDYLALNLEPMGEIPRAETAYKKGLAIDQGPLADSFLGYNYGRLLLKLNRLAESRKLLDRALELAPETRAVHYEHARLNIALDNLPGARADAERALALPDPSGFIIDLQVYNLLVQIYARLGDQASAQKYARLSETAVIPIKARARQ